MNRIVLIGRVALAAAQVGAVGSTPAKLDQARPLLLPVSEADTMKMRVSGCESWFTVGETGYLFAQGSDFLVRIASGQAGLKPCHLPLTEADGFERGVPIACGGRKLFLRQIGRARGHGEADSVDYPAALTVSDGAHVRTLRGRYGTAC